MSKTSQRLGLNLRKIRLELHMTQVQFAKKLKIDTAYLSNLENGKKNPTLETIESIAKTLGIKVEDLVR
ncbi:MAG: DNA-binding protein [Candidatus Vogelbacteria bacterium CG10_big_fil_rev_8_21_14_0_10_51_16]|uniref:DNA-binding protein n=1 Tax=Candidatus Vogelbacteria bacterium CG10_big_fil_rev_8_21_14_0_10_51_16 TaxID=1975045 RepID=A0A2H0RDE0_9BACT|nr:MAG: DNA-binding protein [Candidatus Vogelbacteria bacterium CG10_big_fil_rev_8_21_14_0_10_51_16]